MINNHQNTNIYSFTLSKVAIASFSWLIFYFVGVVYQDALSNATVNEAYSTVANGFLLLSICLFFVVFVYAIGYFITAKIEMRNREIVHVFLFWSDILIYIAILISMCYIMRILFPPYSS